MKLQVKFSNRFKSDLKLAKKQNKNLDKLFLIKEKDKKLSFFILIW